MSEPSKYSNFTASDIERYHSGKMSDRERNAIEKAALEDPFLSDALEGYLMTSTPAADLESIKSRLTEKTARKKYTIPFFRHNRFIKAAAIILLVAGAGWFITQRISSPGKEMAIQNKQQPAPETTVSNNKAAEETIVPPIISDSVSASGNISFVKPSPTINERKEPLTYSRTLPDKESATTLSAAQAEIASAPPMVMKSNIPQKDSSYSIAASDIFGVEIKGDSIKNLNIVMQETDQVLNEVVVLNKRKNRGNINQAKPLEEIEPIGGWEGYNNYALNNLKSPEKNNAKPSEGDVVLSFDINAEGEPVNIKVVESECTSCEKEATRMLQDGPKWKNKNKQNAKIRVRF